LATLRSRGLDRLKKQSSTAASVIALVALTGYGNAEDRSVAIAAGFDCRLVKAVDPDRLKPMIRRLPS
jgi:CheY-like chemotaxis protein